MAGGQAQEVGLPWGHCRLGPDGSGSERVDRLDAQREPGMDHSAQLCHPRRHQG